MHCLDHQLGSLETIQSKNPKKSMLCNWNGPVKKSDLLALAINHCNHCNHCIIDILILIGSKFEPPSLCGNQSICTNSLKPIYLHENTWAGLFLPVAGWPSSSGDTLQMFNLSFKIFRRSAAMRIPLKNVGMIWNAGAKNRWAKNRKAGDSNRWSVMIRAIVVDSSLIFFGETGTRSPTPKEVPDCGAEGQRLHWAHDSFVACSNLDCKNNAVIIQFGGIQFWTSIAVGCRCWFIRVHMILGTLWHLGRWPDSRGWLTYCYSCRHVALKNLFKADFNTFSQHGHRSDRSLILAILERTWQTWQATRICGYRKHMDT